MSHPYVIIDGIRVPIVSGGSDEGDGGDAPAPDTGGDLAGAASSAMDRLDAAFGDSTDVDTDLTGDGAGDPGGDEPVVTGLGDDDQPMSLKEARALRQEQKQYRERWGAFEKAFEGLPEQSAVLGRQVLPLVARGNTDAAFVLGEYANLHPDDQAVIDQIGEAVATNPQAAAIAFADVAAQLRGETDDPEADDDGPDDEYEYEDDEDGPQYLTPEDLDERLAGFMSTYAFQQAEQREVDSILAEVEKLGYDLTSDDVYEQARVESLFALARRLDGDIGKAHQAITGQRQAVVDEYVSGKAADVDRPLPPTAGAPSSGEKRLETLDDGEAAMRARLDAAL